MTIPSVSAGNTIAASWGNDVADQLNELPSAIRAGTAAGTTNSSSEVSVTFDTAFPGAGAVFTVASMGTDVSQYVTVTASNATGFTFKVIGSSGPVGSGVTRTVRYIAVQGGSS